VPRCDEALGALRLLPQDVLFFWLSRFSFLWLLSVLFYLPC